LQICNRSSFLYILWCKDPLLGRDLETDEYSHYYAIGG
jgi:hypothetical protein